MYLLMPQSLEFFFHPGCYQLLVQHLRGIRLTEDIVPSCESRCWRRSSGFPAQHPDVEVVLEGSHCTVLCCPPCAEQVKSCSRAGQGEHTAASPWRQQSTALYSRMNFSAKKLKTHQFHQASIAAAALGPQRRFQTQAAGAAAPSRDRL